MTVKYMAEALGTSVTKRTQQKARPLSVLETRIVQKSSLERYQRNLRFRTEAF